MKKMTNMEPELSEVSETLRALELLLLFRNKNSKMSTKQIVESSGEYCIPHILEMLNLLEKRKFIQKNISGKAFWSITYLGCQTRNRVEKIVGSQSQL
jgi:predicted metal-binding protein